MTLTLFLAPTLTTDPTQVIAERAAPPAFFSFDGSGVLPLPPLAHLPAAKTGFTLSFWARLGAQPANEPEVRLLALPTLTLTLPLPLPLTLALPLPLALALALVLPLVHLQCSAVHRLRPKP